MNPMRNKKRTARLRAPALLAALLLAAGMIAGCGAAAEEAEVSTARFGKDGSVEVVTVETFDQPYYSEDELSQKIEADVEQYNGGADKIKNKGLKVADGVATLDLQYASAQDYTDFNGQPMYYGSVQGALSAGYDLSSLLSAVSSQDSNKIFAQKDFETLADSTAVIVTEPLRVVFPRQVLYATANSSANGANEPQTQADLSADVSAQNPAIFILVK